MSKSFQIVNGDLALGERRSYAVVSGKQKLLQDLKLWVLERIGTDPSTPTYGSRLDGGIIDGQEIPSYIGEVMTAANIAGIRTELINLITAFQQVQYEKIRTETLMFNGKNTLEEGEVLDTIDSVDVRAVGDRVLAQVRITSLAGESFKLTIPLDNEVL